MRYKNLEQEARNFNKLRMIKTNSNDKVLTTRRILAGQALSGIIARSPSWYNKKEEGYYVYINNCLPLLKGVRPVWGEPPPQRKRRVSMKRGISSRRNA